MDVSIRIPARFESTRFPGKPLCLLKGRTMISHVYNNALSAVEILNKIALADHTFLEPMILTDSVRIANHCEENGYAFMMTSKHETGTDRITESLAIKHADFIVNLQGDEPLIDGKTIAEFIQFALKHASDKCIVSSTCALSMQDAVVKDIVKVVINRLGNIQYMSRLPICRISMNTILHSKQCGLYAFTYRGINHFSELGFSSIEASEHVELLRWLDNGFVIKAFEQSIQSFSVDTIQDQHYVESCMASQEC
jgi:3-deoxy-manno-octulosonate cytidylyltransferase (CMP-KDO synthetase)